MTTRILAFTLLLLVGVAGAGDPQADAVKKDLKSLEGRWQIVGMTMVGMPVDENEWKGGEYHFKGVFMGIKEPRRDELSWGKFRIDPTKKPKEIDVETPGKTIKGIYIVDGDKLVLGMPNLFIAEDRPRFFDIGFLTFKSMTMTFKRIKD